jgi:hypothetical protein
MKIQAVQLLDYLKKVLYDDILDRYLFAATIVLSLFDYIAWHNYLSSPDLMVYVRIGIYPVELLAVIITINTLLAITSYNREEELAHLLFIGNIICAFLVLILELFYFLK